jgi:hypothetical protein
LLQTIYKDGVFENETTLSEIRKNIVNLTKNKNEVSIA